jgi:uncharacterized protein YciI
MFLLNVSYTKTPEEVAPQAAAHGEWVKQYFREGVFLFAGPKKSGLGGVIGVKAIDKQRLLKILAEDSFVKADVAEYQIIDFDCKATQAELDALKTA